MDPLAANYDKRATVNTNTWCIPVVRGCMMPLRAPSGVSSHGRDTGGSATYNENATVNAPLACVPARTGCMNPEAVNYDRDATFDDGSCLLPPDGCLDPA